MRHNKIWKLFNVIKLNEKSGDFGISDFELCFSIISTIPLPITAFATQNYSPTTKFPQWSLKNHVEWMKCRTFCMLRSVQQLFSWCLWSPCGNKNHEKNCRLFLSILKQLTDTFLAKSNRLCMSSTSESILVTLVRDCVELFDWPDDFEVTEFAVRDLRVLFSFILFHEHWIAKTENKYIRLLHI